MTTEWEECPNQLDIYDALGEARQARDDGIELTEKTSSDWERNAIDGLISAFAKAGEPFSANALRPLLPEVRRPLIGARFLAASRSGLIDRIGYVASTDKATHAHPVALWIGKPKA